MGHDFSAVFILAIVLLLCLEPLVVAVDEDVPRVGLVVAHETLKGDDGDFMNLAVGYDGERDSVMNLAYRICEQLSEDVPKGRRAAMITTPAAEKRMKEAMASIEGKRVVRQALTFFSDQAGLACLVRKEKNGKYEIYFVTPAEADQWRFWLTEKPE